MKGDFLLVVEHLVLIHALSSVRLHTALWMIDVHPHSVESC